MNSNEERRRRALAFLETEVWPLIPSDQLGRRVDRSVEDEILGFPGSSDDTTDIEPA